MARLNLEDGSEINDFDAIAAAVAGVGIVLHRRPPGDDPALQALLARAPLDGDEVASVLAACGPFLAEEQRDHGATAWDLVVLHPGTPDLDAKLATFATPHTHADDEVRYVLAGEGVFGAVRADGGQVELTVEAGEYIRVPAGLEHWFRMTPLRDIKCVRLFAGPPTWEATFTGTPIRLGPLAA
ncbi:MAG: cupin domain-containing protein [Myxococcales bacterium]|nr:cupin domain-containing protein [Myxococcales bacterium]MCB9546970.1 cupin domain-containing protein [Myxococcales bacterium]